MADNPPIDPINSTRAQPRYEPGCEQTVNVGDSSVTLPKLDDSPPDGGYGWVCVACNAVINGEYL